MQNDPVNHPSHYTDGKIEVIHFIEDKNLGFHLGNTVKYIARAGKKDPAKKLEDLKKAAWYLNRQIELLDKAPEPVIRGVECGRCGRNFEGEEVVPIHNCVGSPSLPQCPRCGRVILMGQPHPENCYQVGQD